MGQLLEKAKQTLETMFNRAFKVLNNGSKFSIKISVYRNYNAPVNKLLQNSNWECDAENLVKFLQTIRAEYGWGNEAVEIGLWQANQETNLSQVILIGDAGANDKSEVSYKRQRNDVELRYSSLFSNPTFYLDELNSLVVKGVTVNAFYLKNSKSEREQQIDIQNFQEIARIGQGKYEFLHLDSQNSSQILIDLITQQVLYSIGGENLVEAYRNTIW